MAKRKPKRKRAAVELREADCSWYVTLPRYSSQVFYVLWEQEPKPKKARRKRGKAKA